MREKSAIELIRAAIEKRGLEVEFELPTDPPAKVKMQAPDLVAIWEEQEIVYQRELARRRAAGDDKLPVNREEWERELENLTPEAREAMLREPPRNLAEQLAQKISRYKTVWQMLPRCLRDAHTNEPLCKTPDDEQALSTYIASDPAVISLLTAKYIELAASMRRVGDDAKNFSETTGVGGGTS